MSVKYYQEKKERLQKEARERYQNLSKEKKVKKQQYDRACYKNWVLQRLSIEKNIMKWE